MTQIEAMTELLTQSNDESDDVIEINSEKSEDDELVYGDSANDDDLI